MHGHKGSIAVEFCARRLVPRAQGGGSGGLCRGMPCAAGCSRASASCATQARFFGLRKLITPLGSGACTQGCVQDTVTCCFTTAHSILGLFVNELDVTLSITPFDKLNDTSVIKTVSFPEPSVDAAIALLGLEANLGLTASAQFRCSSTRRDSAWNFVMDNSFTILKANALAGLDVGWYRNAYVGVDVGLSLGLLGGLDFLTLPGSCGGSLLGLNSLFPFRGNSPYFAYRKLIRPSQECVLQPPEPTPAPTPVPTGSPTVCVPATVTCCFTAAQTLLKLVVNEVDLTSQIIPQNKFDDMKTIKSVTFLEPTAGASIALMAYDASLLGIAGVVNLQCSTPRAASAWNFNAGVDFVSLSSHSVASFPSTWSNNVYTGSTLTVTLSSILASLLSGPTITCPNAQTQAGMLAPGRVLLDTYYVVRRYIEPSGACAA
ncbi:hypothetical protein BASA81_005177 [Batrachochytrium salamandrivorans]|nr:hypothetical protein BASA81_005177 [Batrachochytrium salamandrivorans]